MKLIMYSDLFRNNTLKSVFVLKLLNYLSLMYKV